MLFYLLALLVHVARAAPCSGTAGITMDGIGDFLQLSGDGAEVAGDQLTLKHNAGLSVTSSCNKAWNPQGFKALRLLGKSFSFTVDLSKVGCACNVALYLTSTPARDDRGNYKTGSCSYSPYYCDANQVCGSFCPEVDIMEANNRAFQATPHKCDLPSEAGYYCSCDRNGCSQNTRDLGTNVYGPGPNFRIDTRFPFDVHTSFHGSSVVGADERVQSASFTGMTTILHQGDREVILDHASCGTYLSELAAPMAQGMALRITYWGNTPGNMSWLDQPPCGNEVCSGANAGLATVSNIRVSIPSKIKFPLDFEDAFVGGCPSGWTCMGLARVCSPLVKPKTDACNHPDLRGSEGSRYLSMGSDAGTGMAVSPVFLLPEGIDRVRFRRSGGADRGSGLYVHRRNDGSVLCSAEKGRDTDNFFEDTCGNLADHAGEAVYIKVKDTQRGVWGKTLIDDVHLLSASGTDLSAGQATLLHSGEDCSTGCGLLRGYCSWCGGGNACCSGLPSDPAECTGAAD